MRLIVQHRNILDLPSIDGVPPFRRQPQLRERPRLALQLHLQRVDVVDVDVGVAHDVRQAARHQVADVREHVRQQRVAGDVERDAEAHVAGPLVQLAVQVALRLALPLPFLLLLAFPPRKRDVELREHVARREHHLFQVVRVPGRKDEAAVVRVCLQLVYDVGELVDTLARVIGLRIDVLGAEVAPLEAVDGAQVADLAVREPEVVEELARPVAVPDLDILRAQGGGGRVALDEPQELGDDGAEEDALCG